MNFFERFSSYKRSLIARILWPVNIISFVALFFLCTLMVNRMQTSIESAMQAKTEEISKFLQSVGQGYLVSSDHAALENLAKLAGSDPDFAYVVYYDKDGNAVSDTSRIQANANVTRVEHEIMDQQGTVIGKVAVGFKRDRIDEAYWGTYKLGLVGMVITQLILSLAIFFVAREIVSPLLSSLSRLNKTTDVLANTSADVSKFSEALSSGVNQQAEVVQETTAAMSEMSSMLAQTSNYAKQSEIVMGAVTQKANNGMNVMNQMVDAMTSVQQANDQLQQMVEIILEIGNKTNVINDIVFKTQLLSFNASIEAARAGQHGRGFAVVAEEVGNLAKMSGSAAQEISSLLQDSERQVNEIVRNTSERIGMGKNVTEQALKNFKDIANDINLISTQIQNISSAAREQELGVAQTNQAMTELNKTTDLTGRIAQRTSATSGILSSEVQSLQNISQAIEHSILAKKQINEIDTAAIAAPMKTEKTMAAKPPAPVLPPEADLAQMNAPIERVESVADKIVEMARKQRAERKAKKSS